MIYLILFQILLIALNAIFASAEIAVLSINETKLEKMAEDGNKKAKRLFKLTREPAKFLATIQVAITLSGFLGSAFAADNFSEPLVNWVISLGVAVPPETLDSIAVVLITLILSYFTLIFGELVPKRLAMKKAESVAMGISGLVSGIAWLFKPVVWFLSFSTNLVLRLCGIDPNEAEDDVSEEEIRMMVDAGSEKGTIDTQEKEFIQNVFEFNDITAGDVIRHRTNVTMLFTEDSVDTWEKIIHEERHTRYPVCEGSADNIKGILNAKDFFRLSDRSMENIMKEAVHPAYFVPETIKADRLFRNMKESGNSMAVVLDEYGGMEGIITLFDLIEELVGDLSQEDISDKTPDVESIVKTAPGTWEIKGNVTLKELEEKTGLMFDDNECDTLTGLVFNAIHEIPVDGETNLKVSVGEAEITIYTVNAHQIEKAAVKYISPETSKM